MSRRDICRLARELSTAGLDGLSREHRNILPLIANKRLLWPKALLPFQGVPFGASNHEYKLRELIFLLLVRTALPAKSSPDDATSDVDRYEAYIRKLVRTREAALEAARDLPLSQESFAKGLLAKIWPGKNAATRNARVRAAIEKRIGCLGQCVHNAFVAGFPEWQGNVIFQPDTRLEFADIRNQKGVVYRRKKLLLVFDARDEFRQYIEDSAKPKKREKPEADPPKRPILEKITRSGPDQNIQGISIKEFRERFAFRGVEFGTWLSQRDRQISLAWASSAFIDLAKILDIDEKRIGGNSLGFAFGARGVGRYQAAAAHYDRFFNVINLTKWNGAGSLAHEWAHFVDFTALRPRGIGSNAMPWLYGATSLQGSDLLEERRKNLARMEDRIIGRLEAEDWRQAGEARRKLVGCPDWQEYKHYLMAYAEKAFDAEQAQRYQNYIIAYIEPFIASKEGQFHANARRLDSRRLSPYWASPHELFARAFEKFVFDKLALNDMHNDYLVNLYKHELPPYPDEREMPIIMEKLEEIIKSYAAQ